MAALSLANRQKKERRAYLVGGLVGQGWLEGEEAQEDEGPRRIRAPKAVPGSLGESAVVGRHQINLVAWSLVWSPPDSITRSNSSHFLFLILFFADLVFGIGD
jgi:hypothetical protein